MQSLSETFIRASFLHASRKAVADMSLPESFSDMTEADWSESDFLGWRDPTFIRRAYVIVPRLDGDPVGIALTQAEASPRSRAMCNWCRDVRLPNEVVFWAAKRTGSAGRRGATIGTLACQDFQCSQNVRKDPPLPYDGYDMAAARVRRLDELRLKVASFAEDLIAGG
jgi:hypothetical protein